MKKDLAGFQAAVDAQLKNFFDIDWSIEGKATSPVAQPPWKRPPERAELPAEVKSILKYPCRQRTDASRKLLRKA